MHGNVAAAKHHGRLTIAGAEYTSVYGAVPLCITHSTAIYCYRCGTECAAVLSASENRTDLTAVDYDIGCAGPAQCAILKCDGTCLGTGIVGLGSTNRSVTSAAVNIASNHNSGGGLCN